MDSAETSYQFSVVLQFKCVCLGPPSCEKWKMCSGSDPEVWMSASLLSLAKVQPKMQRDELIQHCCSSSSNPKTVEMRYCVSQSAGVHLCFDVVGVGQNSSLSGLPHMAFSITSWHWLPGDYWSNSPGLVFMFTVNLITREVVLRRDTSWLNGSEFPRPSDICSVKHNLIA